MTLAESAAQLARDGIKVFPVHTIREGACSCGKGCGPKNMGKHPMTKNGVYDASNDVGVVEGWWAACPDANIGIALGDTGDGLYAQDIDDAEIAQKVLELFRSERGPAEFVVATTGREDGGCHIYMKSRSSHRTQNLVTEDGVMIGELRGTGSYVIAPPSVHRSGKAYEFVVGRLGQTALATVGDPRATVLGLLQSIDVRVAPPKARQIIEIGGEDGEIPPIEIVRCELDTSGNTMLAQLLSGTYPSADRSKTLWRLGLEVYNQAKKLGVGVTREQVAGIIKGIDVGVYQKYSGRRDADRWYWEKAIEAEQASIAGKTGGGGKVGDTPYNYSEAAGLTYTKGNRETKLANFRPEILEEQTIIRSEGRETAYLVRCHLPNEETDITFRPKDFDSDRSLRVAWNQLPQLAYIIEPDQYQRTWVAARELSENVRRTQQFSTTGWTDTEYGWGFFLPGAAGAITANGLDERITHYGFAEGVPSRYNLYGEGVRPAETLDEIASASVALSDMLDMLPAQVLLPTLDLVLGAPLRSLGLNTSPPLVHIYGTTGQLKTTSVLLIMGLLGRFETMQGNLESVVPETWGSTVASLQHGLHILRDLPLLIDDFKLSNVKAVDAGRLVQNYADGTVRSRMAPDQSRRESLTPQSLLISTGEERWEQEQSVQARMFSLMFPFLETRSSEFADRLRRIETVQNHARQGSLGLIGGTYLRFLARIGQEKLSETVAAIRVEERRVLTLPIHARIIDTLASMRIVERVFTGFLKSEFPTLVERFLALREENWAYQQEWLLAEAREAENLSPARQVLAAIRGGLLAGRVSIEERRVGGSYGEMLAPDRVAFFDEAGVYLLEYVTWEWYKRLLQRSGEKPLFSWRAVKSDARNSLGGQNKQLWEDRSRESIYLPHDIADLLGVRERARGVSYFAYGKNFGAETEPQNP